MPALPASTGLSSEADKAPSQPKFFSNPKSKTPSVGLISLSQRTFLFLGRVRVTLCQGANELSLGTSVPGACPS